ncbi:MAG: LVIVD repeat-containing protein, partial [Pyrinomonadaceae bacterium]
RIDENRQETWGDVPADDAKLAHNERTMTCYTCHSSWMTSCFGCHLSMRANARMPNRHFEGETSRNFTTYNFQVLRDDVFMLGRDGTVTGRRVAPAASRSAILVSSQNQNREWIYSQQQTISAEGFSGQSFATHVPHTVRTTETKTCSDCHVSDRGDNNAWMAQLLMQGTNFVNFMGRYVYVAAEDALEVVPVTERDEPQAVYGSALHEVAYPDDFKEFVAGGRKLKTVYEHKGNPEVLGVQLRGEYAYVAAGSGGLRVYDVAQIDHKGFSERITTAPVSRFGQKFWVDTKYATAVASPTTLGVDPARWRMTADGRSVDPAEAKRIWDEWLKLPVKEREGRPAPLVNEEQPIHPMYAYLYVVDREEGLILVNAATLLDGDPLNNYLRRATLTVDGQQSDHFNPGGLLNEANNITIAGTFAYVTTSKGLVVIDIDEPTEPRVVKTIGEPLLRHPRSIAVQFRYGFVADDEGLKVIDLTLVPPGPCNGPVAVPCKSLPRAQVVSGAAVPLAHASDVYVARTYAYVADGPDGIAIVDVTRPEAPRLHMKFNAEGQLNDTHQVKVAMTNASLFAYVADGKNGLRILQLTSPETMPTYGGFSPAPEPRLIATFRTKGPALAVSKGLDRDRAVDESGNQLAVFGRRGARPFTLEEMQRLYLLDGRLRTVLDPDELKAPP